MSVPKHSKCPVDAVPETVVELALSAYNHQPTIGDAGWKDHDAAEFHIVVTAVQRAAEFAAGQPCLCTPEVTDPDVLATPCARCLVLGRRGDRLEER